MPRHKTTAAIALEPQLNSQDIANILGVHAVTVRNWAREGKMPAPVRFSRKALRWPRSVIEKWLRQRKARRAGGGPDAA
jgi:excisionase family DNA binding protein